MARAAVLAPAILCSLLFSACGPADVTEVIDGVKQTASGALKEASLVRDRAVGEYDAAKERVDNIRDGLQKINEGKELLRRGITGTGAQLP